MNRKEYLLNKIAQEAVEVAKEATKCLEFGTDDSYPLSTGESDGHKLRREFLELVSVIGMAAKEGFLPEFSPSEAIDIIEAKEEKVNYWAEYSKKKGCLVIDRDESSK